MGHGKLKGLAVILLSVMFGAGCLATALVGAGATGAIAGYKWMEGTLIREYPRPLSEMEQAVQKVCKYYSINITERNVSPMKATLSGVDQNKDEVKIFMEALPNNITAVGVRVGGFVGNKAASEMFHTQLAKELGL